MIHSPDTLHCNTWAYLFLQQPDEQMTPQLACGIPTGGVISTLDVPTFKILPPYNSII